MNYIKGFDALRALSIVLVLSSHLGLYQLLPEIEYVQTRFWNLISSGTGVQIFFTLSGFLITMILLRERTKNGKINIKNFYIRRFLRLIPPLIIFYALIILLMSSGSIQSNVTGIVYSFFYAYNYIPQAYYSAELGHTWTLALEEQFYLIWPLLLSFVKKLGGISVIIAITLGACIAGYYLMPSMEISQTYNTGRWFIPAVGPIMIGSFFAILEHHYRENWKKRFRENKGILWFSIILFFYTLYAPQPMLIYATLVRSIGIAMLLIWLMHNQDAKFLKFLEMKPLRYIGRISYGLYVFQGLFLTTGPSNKLLIQQLPLNIILTFAVAIASYELVEKPILRLKKNFIS